MDIYIPEKLRFLLTKKSRYKVAWGGRGAAKSWSFGSSTIIRSLQKKTRILCAREYQSSISQSVMRLLENTIDRLGLEDYFDVTKTNIICKNGSDFFFSGLHHNIENIKSIEAIDIVWVEEATKVSKGSWKDLIPTIRRPGSEIWISFNPDLDEDETYKRFVLEKRDDCISVKINYYDNKYFPVELQKEMEYDKKNDYQSYLNVWEGQTNVISEAIIFKGKTEVRDFNFDNTDLFYLNRYFFGVDWGFSSSPLAMIRCFIIDHDLYIDYELYELGLEFEDIEKKFKEIPGSSRWPIQADSNRPETISYMQRAGFNISPANKWKGSVEDGIEYLKSFRKIIVHPRCENTVMEFNKYSWKVDKISEKILPIPVKDHDHLIDSLRYALDSYIKKDVGSFDIL